MALILDPPKWLTSAEAAAYLGIQRQTLDCWRSTRRYTIPYTRIGRSVRYDVRDLDAWLASRRVCNKSQD